MSPREQRTIRFGIAGGALILVYVLLLDPYLTARAETRTLIEEREAQHGRLVALDLSLPAYRRRLEVADATWQHDVVPQLLPSDIPAVAASALSEEVRRIAAQSFLEVERENVLQWTEVDGLTSVPVQFSLRGDIYGLRDFLAAIESSESFLNLQEVRVTAIAGGFNQPGVSRGAPLQITVTVEGYLGGGPLVAEPAGAASEPAGSALGGDATGASGTGGTGEGLDALGPGGASDGVPPGGAADGLRPGGASIAPAFGTGLPPNTPNTPNAAGTVPGRVGARGRVPAGAVAGPAPGLTTPTPAGAPGRVETRLPAGDAGPRRPAGGAERRRPAGEGEPRLPAGETEP